MASTTIAISILTILIQEVTGINRNMPPTVNGCPTATISAQAPSGQWKTKVEWNEPTAVGEPDITVQQTHWPNKNYFYVGWTYVTYLFIDSQFNVATCQFAVSVTSDLYPAYDTLPPILKCPPQKTAVTASETSSMKVIYSAEASDNSGEEVYLYYYPSSGSSFSPGVHTVWVFAADKSNNRAYCSFDVVVSVRPTVGMCRFNAGDIFGAVLGITVGILAIEITLYIVCNRYKNNQHKKSTTAVQNETTGPVSRHRYRTNPVASPQQADNVPPTYSLPDTCGDLNNASNGYQSLDPATREKEHGYMSMNKSQGSELINDMNNTQQDDDDYLEIIA